MDFLLGIKFGLLISLLIGTSTILIFNYTITKGIKNTIFLCFGFWLADLIQAISINFILKSIDINFNFNKLYIINSIILIIISLKIILDRNRNINDINIDTNHKTTFISGLTLGISNPKAYIIWFGMLTYASKIENENTNNYAVIMGYITTIIASDICKIYIFQKSKKFISSKIVSILNLACAITLFVLSILNFIKNYIFS